MKSLKYILIFTVSLLSFTACENDPIKFDDYGLTTCYFPYQFPARTIVLGKYDLGNNDNDNNHVFEIGVTMSGVYENKINRKVYFKVDESLLSKVTNVKALPASYYTIETESPVTIPSGSTKGRIKIHLTDAFFNDPLSIASLESVNYVVPLSITEVESLDSIISGIVADGVTNPLKTRAEDWSILPKDYTLFGIKFINKYHGYYLRRGADKLNTFDAINNTYIYNSTTVYKKQYVEKDEVVMVTSNSLNSVVLSNIVRRGNLQSPGEIKLKLTFNGDNCKIYNNLDLIEIGSGKFVENGDAWGGNKKDVIYLDYEYLDATNNEKHQVKDTLVIRDRAVVFEQFIVKLEN